MAGYTFTLQSRKYGPQTFEFCDRGAGTYGALKYRGGDCCYGGKGLTNRCVIANIRSYKLPHTRRWLTSPFARLSRD